MKYIHTDEEKPLKDLVRDATFVFMCSFVGGIAYFKLDGSIADFFNILTEAKTLHPAAAQVFTDEPGF
jgi:hypothetical protein